MNSNLLSLFGKMFPDYCHPALAAGADGTVCAADPSQAKTRKPATFAEALNFVGEFYQSIEGPTFSRSFPRLGSSGTMERGQFLTLNTLVCHSADDAYSVCSLARILEPNVAQKYYLSARACRGILNRADRRGRTLPLRLRQALEAVATGTGKDGTQTMSPRQNKKTKSLRRSRRKTRDGETGEATQ